jgi:polyisoprenyl-phosphate glycosyltransferase
MKFSVIIPCFNEEQFLLNLLKMLLPLQVKYDLEYIFVENGSSDKSKDFFKKNIENKFTNVKVVYIDKNIGYGFGIQQGLKSAQGEYVGWFHADSQILVNELKKFFDAVLNSDDRKEVFLKAMRHKRSLSDFFFTVGQGLFSSMLFGKWLLDIAATPVIFTESLLTNIEKMPNDFSIDIFIHIEAIKKGFEIERINVDFNERKEGSSSWNVGIISKLKQSKKVIVSSFKIRIGRKVL